jgi:hypothetical protein
MHISDLDRVLGRLLSDEELVLKKLTDLEYPYYQAITYRIVEDKRYAIALGDGPTIQDALMTLEDILVRQMHRGVR